jgi:hypothetical protein
VAGGTQGVGGCAEQRHRLTTLTVARARVAEELQVSLVALHTDQAQRRQAAQVLGERQGVRPGKHPAAALAHVEIDQDLRRESSGAERGRQSTGACRAVDDQLDLRMAAH